MPKKISQVQIKARRKVRREKLLELLPHFKTQVVENKIRKEALSPKYRQQIFQDE